MNNVIAMPADGLRQAPANAEAERALLGTLMMRNGQFDAVADFLRPEHFSDPANAETFAKLRELIEQGKKAEPVSMKAAAETIPAIKEAGGMKYLVGLVAGSPTYVNAGDYGQIIYDAFLRRELIALSSEASHNAYEAQDTAKTQIEVIEERLFALSTERSESSITPIGAATGEAIASAEIAYKADGALVGITTGLADLDHKLGGLHASDLIILAGRPSMGKSGLALSIAFSAAKAGKAVAFFSLEMGAAQLANRALAYATGIDSHKIRNGRLSGTDFVSLARVAQDNGKLNLNIDDRSSPTIPQIRTACRRMKRKGLDLIVIDYLQLITPTRAGREENRVAEVSGISRGLKAIARDLNVPVLCLSQLSRNVEQREDKRPQLSDLRESGSIEQDADVVMFVYRDEYYQTRNGGSCSPEMENVAEINISKQRHGPIGRVLCRFEHKSAWFENLENRRA